jgi:TonB family protein
MKTILSTSLFVLLFLPLQLLGQNKDDEKKIAPPTESRRGCGESYPMPQFPGGQTALRKFFDDNIIYPKSAYDNCISGKVVLQFVINVNGSVSHIKVLRGLGKDFDEEAIRVVALMPNWKPGGPIGEEIAIKYTIPVKFSFPTD